MSSTRLADSQGCSPGCPPLRSAEEVPMKMLAVLLVAVATVTAVGAQQSSTQTARPQPVTFTKDVAPILQRNCQQCHRPGSVAPMSLLTYQDARPWARSIKQKVVAREMPPWHIDRTVGI